MLILYSYYRSSASYRVRIALHYKGLPFEYESIHMLKDGGQQHSDSYRAINPAGLVPALIDGGKTLTQSLAIMEYLEETYPDNPIMPQDAASRAIVRALAQTVACEIHPLDNLRVLKYLKNDLGISDEAKSQWYAHWIELGFAALETQLASVQSNPDFCFGDTPTIADFCLIPQVYNANRFEVDLTPYPRIRSINDACLALDAFAKAVPEVQVDAA